MCVQYTWIEELLELREFFSLFSKSQRSEVVLFNFEGVSLLKKRIVGVYDEEVPPVPIPNTVVKLLGAENTWLETARENRAMPTFSSSIQYAPLAQLVEQLTLNQWVPGSSP